ncbi:MAG: 30S ribosomal protein S17 [Dehalococcoidia bacterium]
MSEGSGQRKVQTGRVVSDKMDKTVVVAVERRVHHPLYHKSIRQKTKFKAHDEQNAYRVGDLVRITETRPLSSTKRWRVSELLNRVELPEDFPTESQGEEQKS